MKSFAPLSPNTLMMLSLALIATLLLGNLLAPWRSLSNPDLQLISRLLDWGIAIPALFHFGLQRSVQQADITPSPLKRLASLPLKLVIWAGVAAAIYSTDNTGYLKKQLLYYYPHVVLVLAMLFFSWSLWKIIAGWSASTAMHGEARIQFIARYCFGQGRVAELIRGEWLGLYYLLAVWGKAPAPQENEFGYQQNSSTNLVLLIVSLFSLPEMLAFHLVINHWSAKAAWLVTGFSIYFLYIIPAQFKAVKHRPVKLSEQHLLLRNGVLIDAKIPYADIDTVQSISATHPMLEKKTTLKACLLDAPNLLLTFRRPCQINMVAGIQKSCCHVALALDEPAAFIAALHEKLAGNCNNQPLD